jgi:hypothetical protein
MTVNNATEDLLGRQVTPIVTNTVKDGSGTWYFPLVDSDGKMSVTMSDGTGIITTMTHTQPSIAAQTTAALAANPLRLYALIVNDSNETIYINLGAAAVLNQGIRLNASGGSYEMSKKFGNLYVGAINAISTSGSKVLVVTEGV